MVVILLGFAPALSFAADEQKPLMDLGRDFATKISGDLRASALYLSGAGRLQLAEQRAGTIIPDGEPLLLRLLVGPDSVSAGTQDIYTIKKNGRLMISLGDFVGATGMAIKVKPDDGTASGWFIREAQTFSFDAKAGVAVIAGKSVAVDPQSIDTQLDDNHIFVSADTLEKWFGLTFDYNFSALNLLVTGPQRLPVEEAYLRSQKSGGRVSSDSKPKLPYYSEGYSLLSQPYIDTNINANIDHTPGNRATKNQNWSTIYRGDLAGFNAKGFVAGSARQPSTEHSLIDSARITLGKEDVDGNLLGPLKATSYSFGDIASVSNSLIGGGEQEAGFTVTNRSLDRVTTQTATQIKGDAQPGWDVELYRNELFIDIRRVDSAGRYDFGDVDLVIGENDFKLLFFGPQGETREEHQRVGVSSNTLAGDTGNYDVSLSRNKRAVWEEEPQTGPGVGSPHFAARYEYGLGNLGTVNAGIRTNSDAGVYRTFAQTGISSFFLDTFLNADIGVDTGTGAYGSVLTARRNFGKQSLLLQQIQNSETYNPSSPDVGAFIKNSYRAALNGPLINQFLFFNRTNYSLSAGYTEAYNNSNQLSLSGSTTTRVRSILFSAGMSYTKRETPPLGANIGNFVTDSGAGTVTANFNARGPFYGGVWRLGAQYDIKPQTQMKNATLEYSRQLASNLSSTTEIGYVPTPQLAAIKTTLNWQTSIATISPRFEYDSKHNASAGVNVRYAMGADPFTYKYKLYNTNLSESGGVAARIFTDKNGSGVFDGDDELLQDAQLIAIQGQRSAVSNEDGIAFIPDLQKNQMTDIVVSSSSDDAYGISLFSGVSIRPHPGSVTKLEFPIVQSGELDGQANTMNASGKLASGGNISIALVAPDGRIEKSTSTASDGYWSISIIRPGTYYLVADGDSDDGYFIPQQIQFKADGSTYFGQAVNLAQGHPVSFTFRSVNPPPDGDNHARVIVPSDIASQQTELALGDFNSRLAMTFAWYKLKLDHAAWFNSFALITPLAQITPDDKGLLRVPLRPLKTLTMTQAAAACQGLKNTRLTCAVNVITTYRNSPLPEPVVVAAKAPVQPEPENAAQVSGAVADDAKNIIVVRPTIIQPDAGKQIISLNLGSYNSRELMAVIWYKLKTRYGAQIGNAHLAVKPTEATPSAETGKYTLRAIMPLADIEDAKARCSALSAQKQFCAVEVTPANVQGMLDQ